MSQLPSCAKRVLLVAACCTLAEAEPALGQESFARLYHAWGLPALLAALRRALKLRKVKSSALQSSLRMLEAAHKNDLGGFAQRAWIEFLIQVLRVTVEPAVLEEASDCLRRLKDPQAEARLRFFAALSVRPERARRLLAVADDIARDTHPTAPAE